MRVIDWKDFTKGTSPPKQVALTIGTFDSLHVGHQRLIREVVDNGCGALGAVCTFHKNPALTLGSRPIRGSILSLTQKINKLEALGVALVVLIDFSAEISKLSGKRFLNLLADRLDIKKLVVGYNFHMGRGRDTNARELVDMLAGSQTELEVIPATRYQEEVVSSSRIRESILQGRFQEVKDMLKDDFRLDLSETSICRSGGSSWVRRSEIHQVLPRRGEYRVLFSTESTGFPGILCIEDEQISWQREFAGTEIEIRFLESE
jgi:riboflavin kinase/FMN adenylyltransferase